MDQGQIFVLAIIGMSLFAGVMRMGIMAKHGLHDRGRTRRWRRHPIGLMIGGMIGHDGDDYDSYGPVAQRKIELLSSENEKLTSQIGRLEERLRVLERIATDPGTRTAREIDALRDAG